MHAEGSPDVWDEWVYVVDGTFPLEEEAGRAVRAVLRPVHDDGSRLSLPVQTGRVACGDRFTVTLRRYVPPAPHWNGPFDDDSVTDQWWDYVGDRPPQVGAQTLGRVRKTYEGNRLAGWQAVVTLDGHALVLGAFSQSDGLERAKRAVEGVVRLWASGQAGEGQEGA